MTSPRVFHIIAATDELHLGIQRDSHWDLIFDTFCVTLKQSLSSVVVAKQVSIHDEIVQVLESRVKPSETNTSGYEQDKHSILQESSKPISEPTTSSPFSSVFRHFVKPILALRALKRGRDQSNEEKYQSEHDSFDKEQKCQNDSQIERTSENRKTDNQTRVEKKQIWYCPKCFQIHELLPQDSIITTHPNTEIHNQSERKEPKDSHILTLPEAIKQAEFIPDSQYMTKILCFSIAEIKKFKWQNTKNPMVFVQVERATHKHTRIASTNTEKSIKLNDMIGDIPKRFTLRFSIPDANQAFELERMSSLISMIGAKCLARRAAIAASRQCQKIMNIFIGDLAMEPNHSGQLSTISRFSRSEHIEASEGTAMSLFSGLGHWLGAAQVKFDIDQVDNLYNSIGRITVTTTVLIMSSWPVVPNRNSDHTVGIPSNKTHCVIVPLQSIFSWEIQLNNDSQYDNPETTISNEATLLIWLRSPSLFSRIHKKLSHFRQREKENGESHNMPSELHNLPIRCQSSVQNMVDIVAALERALDSQARATSKPESHDLNKSTSLIPFALNTTGPIDEVVSSILESSIANHLNLCGQIRVVGRARTALLQSVRQSHSNSVNKSGYSPNELEEHEPSKENSVQSLSYNENILSKNQSLNSSSPSTNNNMIQSQEVDNSQDETINSDPIKSTKHVRIVLGSVEKSEQLEYKAQDNGEHTDELKLKHSKSISPIVRHLESWSEIGRREVAWGWMQKQGEGGPLHRRTWKRRFFVLYHLPQGHFLCYFLQKGTDDQKIRGTIDLRSAQAVLPATISLQNPSILSHHLTSMIFNQQNASHGIQICTPQRTWYLIPESIVLPFDAQIDKNKELTEESNQLGSTAEWLAVLQRTVSFELFSETFAINTLQIKLLSRPNNREKKKAMSFSKCPTWVKQLIILLSSKQLSTTPKKYTDKEDILTTLAFDPSQQTLRLTPTELSVFATIDLSKIESELSRSNIITPNISSENFHSASTEQKLHQNSNSIHQSFMRLQNDLRSSPSTMQSTPIATWNSREVRAIKVNRSACTVKIQLYVHSGSETSINNKLCTLFWEFQCPDILSFIGRSEMFGLPIK